MKTELRFLLPIIFLTLGFCINPNTETNSVELNTDCYFSSNEVTEIYNVMENNTLTNEISINSKNVIDFYSDCHDIPEKIKEEKDDSDKTLEEVNNTSDEEETNDNIVEPVTQVYEVKQEEKVEEPVQPVVTYVADPNLDLASQIVNYALQFVGNPYVYGGTSLTSGTDCSGFTQSVFANFGISLPRSSRDQASVGNYVPIDQIQVGDLVLYGYGSVSHVALYIGNGEVVHALNPAQGIGVTTYTLMPIITVRRVL